VAVSPLHLVLLPLPISVSVTEALAAIGRLERQSPLEVLDAVVVERRQDGTVGVASISPPVGAEIDIAAWRWLLDRILDRPEPAGGAEPVEGLLGRTGLSESFVAEVAELLATPGQSLVFIVSGLDPGAAVSELRGFPGTRLVYGVLPRRLIERMLPRPMGAAPPAQPFDT
jgi:uncharacterized membrane protein